MDLVSATKRWVPDEESGEDCPICSKKFEPSLMEGSVTGKTHCRYCGGVYCVSCCASKLYMPDGEIVRPPVTETISTLRFDASDKQKCCSKCAKILQPHQAEIKETLDAAVPAAAPLLGSPRSSLSRMSSFSLSSLLEKPKVQPPYYTITISQAENVSSSSSDSVFVQASVGSASYTTSAAKNPSKPCWGDEPFDVHVASEEDNTVSLKCYVDGGSGRECVGEISEALTTTGEEGRWVDLKRGREGAKVKLCASFTGLNRAAPVVSPKTKRKSPPGPGSPTGRSPTIKAAKTFAAQSPHAPDAPTKGGADAGAAEGGGGGVLGFLQDKSWIVYLLFLVAAVAFKALSTPATFSGDQILFKPGASISNGKYVASPTHHLLMHKSGSLKLCKGAAPLPVPKGGKAPKGKGEGEEGLGGVEWESGKPYADKDCPKCVASLDKGGEVLTVKDGKTVLRQFSVTQEGYLSDVITTTPP